MKQESRIDEVDLLRGLAAILMILGHSFIVYPVDISGVPWCKAVQHFIYTFHMEMFFVLAGVVYQCRNYKEFMIKKVKRILIPYLFFGAVTVIVKAFGGIFVNGTESLGEGIFKLFFVGGSYWFLYVLFLLFVIYPFIEKICNKLWKNITLAFVLLIWGAVIERSYLFLINKLIYYIPYFIFGNCTRKYNLSMGDRNKVKYMGGYVPLSCIVQLI